MKKKMQKLLTVVMAIACMAFSLVGCGGAIAGANGGSAAGDGDTIKIGLVFSLTGGTAITEECMYNSAVLAIDEINKAGGINGKKIEYVVKDYATDPDTAVKVVREMIQQDGVCAIVGPYTSSARVAIEPLMEEYNIFHLYIQHSMKVKLLIHMLFIQVVFLTSRVTTLYHTFTRIFHTTSICSVQTQHMHS